jgi:hypothetical protein
MTDEVIAILVSMSIVELDTFDALGGRLPPFLASRVRRYRDTKRHEIICGFSQKEWNDFNAIGGRVGMDVATRRTKRSQRKQESRPRRHRKAA